MGFLFLQGFPVMTLANFEDILLMMSSLIMKGCFFAGELPGWLVESGRGTKVSFQSMINKCNQV